MLHFLQRLFTKGKGTNPLPTLAGAVVVDVRTRGEFAQGHYSGAANIPLNEMGQNIETIRNWHKPVITVCQSGQRSKMASALLHAAGIEAYNGGSWTALKKMEQQ